MKKKKYCYKLISIDKRGKYRSFLFRDLNKTVKGVRIKSLKYEIGKRIKVSVINIGGNNFGIFVFRSFKSAECYMTKSDFRPCKILKCSYTGKIWRPKKIVGLWDYICPTVLTEKIPDGSGCVENLLPLEVVR